MYIHTWRGCNRAECSEVLCPLENLCPEGACSERSEDACLDGVCVCV